MTGGQIPSVVIPNFVDDHAAARSQERDVRTGWVVVSRLSAEKGVAELVDIWPEVEDLLVIGDGPELARVRHAVEHKPRVRIVRTMPRSELRRVFSEKTGLIFPSRWHEVAPQVVVEAMCAGLPVVVFSDSDVASDVIEAGAGQCYSGAAELRRALADVRDEWASYSANARLKYEAEWTPARWLDRILSLYRREAR